MMQKKIKLNIKYMETKTAQSISNNQSYKPIIIWSLFGLMLFCAYLFLRVPPISIPRDICSDRTNNQPTILFKGFSIYNPMSTGVAMGKPLIGKGFKFTKSFTEAYTKATLFDSKTGIGYIIVYIPPSPYSVRHIDQTTVLVDGPIRNYNVIPVQPNAKNKAIEYIKNYLNTKGIRNFPL